MVEDDVLDIALHEGVQGLRRHEGWLWFGLVGGLVLTLGVAWFMLVPNGPLLLAGTHEATVTGPADNDGQVEVVVVLEGQELTGTVYDSVDNEQFPVYVEQEPRVNFLHARGVRMVGTLGAGLVLLFGGMTLSTGRSLVANRKARRRMSEDLDPSGRDEQEMVIQTRWITNMYSNYSKMTFFDPASGERRFKSRFYSVRLPELSGATVTVYGRLEPGGNAVVRMRDGSLVPLREPLVRPLIRRRIATSE